MAEATGGKEECIICNGSCFAVLKASLHSLLNEEVWCRNHYDNLGAHKVIIATHTVKKYGEITWITTSRIMK
jgi:hypothetical protein